MINTTGHNYSELEYNRPQLLSRSVLMINTTGHNYSVGVC